MTRKRMVEKRSGLVVPNSAAEPEEVKEPDVHYSGSEGPNAYPGQVTYKDQAGDIHVVQVGGLTYRLRVAVDCLPTAYYLLVASPRPFNDRDLAARAILLAEEMILADLRRPYPPDMGERQTAGEVGTDQDIQHSEPEPVQQ